MKRIFIALISFATLCSFNEDKQVKLIIDAGHGGSDAGAISAAGDKESDLSLQFATALYTQAKLKNIEAVLTRSSDEYRTLTERANTQADADAKTFFVSFHMNTENSHQKRGGEVIYSGTNVNNVASKALAEKITAALNRLNSVPTVLTDKNLVVLKDNAVPAIVVSPGYISNEQDLRKLKDPGIQKELAMLIVKAIQE